jgi:CheY-like chemotaxis protein
MSESKAGRLAILIVDDDDDLRNMLHRMLSSLEYRVESVSDAGAAIASISAQPPDIILTDIYMPAGDGFELLNWLRANDKAIPVVAMSGSGSVPNRYDQLTIAERLGAAAVIDKPFRQSLLVETLDRVLANRGTPPRN